jgi:hypothetical protein
LTREHRESGPVAPEITIQGDIGGATIAIVELVSGLTAAKLDDRLDMYRRAIERQRAHNSLVEALVDLHARTEALESLPQRRIDAAKARVQERARLAASFEAAGQLGGRRQEGMSRQQKQRLDEFDAQTPVEMARFDAERAQLEKEIPLYEAQVARQRAIIAGRDRSEVIGFKALPEAAE